MDKFINIIWYKRDLRVQDHAPLTAAAHTGAPILPLYVIEPSVIHHYDFATRHYWFIRESLLELRENLAARGMPLVVRVGEVFQVLESIRADFPNMRLWAYEETGNMLTYQRDIAVRRWCKANGITFVEIAAGGVVRSLPSRDVWSKIWEERIRTPQAIPPDAIRLVDIAPGPIPTSAELGLAPDHMTERQRGGELEAGNLLHSFLYERGRYYHREMSSPLSAWESCSRLSAHFAYGTLSIKQAVMAMRSRRRELYDMPPEEYAQLDGSWKSAMTAFNSRLHWRDHFMQKLEDEPEVEFEPFIRAFADMRNSPNTSSRNADNYAAWQTGHTGYPMIDACMRALINTGWLNFRMRAMLVSFGANDLWINWKSLSVHLSRLWVDYEPGIHICQVQMQAGVTGISRLRMYNPTKQAHDQDPDGVFIRRWLPELNHVPTNYIHAPHLMPADVQRDAKCIIGQDYPAPIVDHAIAVRLARQAISAVRRLPETRDQISASYIKHGSRRRQPNRSTTRKPQSSRGVDQLSLFEEE